MQKITETKVADQNLVATRSPERADVVVVKMPQGYDARIVIRFVPGRDIRVTPALRGCQPRQGAPRRDAEPVPLPEGLAGKLREVNAKVVAWLARDDANPRLFLTRPVEALMKAGVELTRAEQKALTRAHGAVRETTVVPPGVRVAELSASANPRGRVGETKPTPRTADGNDSDCGCGPTGKD